MHLHFLTLAFPGSLGWREESEHLHQQHSLLSSLGLHFLKPSKRALAGGAEQGLPQGWVQISACRDAGGAARHSWAPQSGAASNAAQPLPFLMNHTSSHFSHISLGDRSARFVFWMNFVRASRRDFFGKGLSYSLTDSKKHEIVGVFFFFWTTAWREKMWNILRAAFLHTRKQKRHSSPFLTPSVCINANYFRNKTSLTSFKQARLKQSV